MAAHSAQGSKLLHGFKPLSRFEKGLGAQLPEAYRKFWHEWKIQKPIPVHSVVNSSKWKMDPITFQVQRQQFRPIPTILPPESSELIFGEAAIIKGYQKRKPHVRRVPHFWVPVLRRSVVFSSVLNRHISVTLTDRTMDLIHDNRGFDHYICKTPACDLQSTLALKLKRNILQTLQLGCPTLKSDITRQQLVLSQYSQYLDMYTPEEVDWYGLTFVEAINKLQNDIRKRERKLPQKYYFREQLINQLMESQKSEKTS